MSCIFSMETVKKESKLLSHPNLPRGLFRSSEGYSQIKNSSKWKICLISKEEVCFLSTKYTKFQIIIKICSQSKSLQKVNLCLRFSELSYSSRNNSDMFCHAQSYQELPEVFLGHLRGTTRLKIVQNEILINFWGRKSAFFLRILWSSLYLEGITQYRTFLA